MKGKLEIFVLLILGFAGKSLAGSGTGIVTKIQTNADGYALVYLANGFSTSCSDNLRFAVDASTEGGKIILSNMLTAQSTGQSVYIQGSGSCGVGGYTSVEMISYARSPN